MASPIRHSAEHIGSLAHVQPERLIGDGAAPCAAVWSHAPVAAAVQGLPHQVLVLHLAGSTLVEKWVDGRLAGHRSRIGSVSLVPARVRSDWVLRGWSQVVHVYLDPDRLAGTADSLGMAGAGLGDFFAEDDAPTAALVRGMLALAQAGSFDVLAQDELMARLLPHLLRRFPAGHAPVAGAGGRLGLTGATLRHLFAHIDERLNDPPRLAELAAQARLSEDHFVRAFAAAVGQTPHQYVLARRIAHTKRLLLTTTLPVAGIAAAGGFRSASHFAAAFRHHVGMTPTTWRQRRH